jgi:phospholipase A1
VNARRATLALAFGLAALGCATTTPQEAPPPAKPSWLGDLWELDSGKKRGSFRLVPHDVTFAAGHYTSNPNQELRDDPNEEVKHNELEIQVSVKTKINEGLGSDRVDLWLGYTQSMWMQIYQPSGPMREIDYTPELMLVTRVDQELGPVNLRMVNFGLSHQSNGESNSLSRSWNRLYAQLGFEWDEVALLFRPWWRIPDSDASDDNEDITDFLGNGDLVMHWERSGFMAQMLVRNNLDFDENHGAFELSCWTPSGIHERLKIFGRYFTGFGASISDYNHRSQTFTLGFALGGWN